MVVKMSKKTVNQLQQQLSNCALVGSGEIVITGMTADSRAVKEGDMFLAIVGHTVDGHRFIDKAIENGAKAVLVSKEVEVPEGVAVLKVEDTKEAIKVIAPYFYDYPADSLRMIGITGTNGKTTTSHIIAHVLEKAGYKVGVIGTVHVLINGKSYPVHNTTPDVADLQPILRQMVDEGVTHCVMEVSSHALDEERVAGVEYDTAVFTNLTQDHLDYHKTFENYLAAKAKLFEKVSAAGKKSPKGAVINMDDPYGERILEKTTAPVLTYAIEKEANLRGKNVALQSNSMQFTFVYEGKEYELPLKITGLFNVYNTLAAIGAVLLEGVELQDILEYLGTFHAVPGRFELVEEGQNFAVVVDYAHTPDGLENVLKTARGITDKRVLVVFGCGGDRDATKRPIMGRIAATYGDKVYVTSDNPRTEDPKSIVEEVAVGVVEGLREGITYQVIVDRREAIHQAIRDAEAGDVVLIAGKGHEDYQILKDRTIHFDDREVAREALKEK